MTITADQIKNARRLNDLADEARHELHLWTDSTVRSELMHIARQLDEAGRRAITSSDIYGDAWCEAGTLTLRKYIGARKMIEHL